MNKNIPFFKYRFAAYALSLLMFIGFSAYIFAQGGLNWGIDFSGGVKLTASFTTNVSSESIMKTLDKANITASVQQIGLQKNNEYIISTKLLTNSESSEESYRILEKALLADYPNFTKLGIETVGPSIGSHLKDEAVKLSIIAIIMMMIYLAVRFEIKFSFGAVAALVHDVALSILFCGVAGVEINVPVIAALLTIFGYSVNDTIVIFDRIRENIDSGSAHSFVDIINSGISQSISRTLLTSFTTLLAVISLYVIGGESINDFALVLLFGIFVGTYSSVYIASPVVNMWNRIASK